MRLWTRLDRMIARELRAPFYLGLGGFTMVFLVNFAFLLARETIEKAVPARLILGFLLAQCPYILAQTFPMAAVLAVLVGVGRLASQSELIALRANGVSYWRLFRPVLAVALFLALTNLTVSHFFRPLGRSYRQELTREMWRMRDLSKEIDPGVFFDGLADSVFYADRAVNSFSGRILEGILLYRELDRGRIADLVVARRGQADFDGGTGKISLRLDDVEWHLFEHGKPDSYTLITSPHKTLTFAPDVRFLASTDDRGTRFSPKAVVGFDLLLAIQEFRYFLDAPATGNTDRLLLDTKWRKAVNEWSERWAYPLAIPFVIFAAFPLAARTRRGGRFTGLAQAILIIFVFWQLMSLGSALSEDQNTLPPGVGMWIAHVVSFVWGLILWRRLLQNREQVPRVRVWLRALFDLLTRRSASVAEAREEDAVARRPRRWTGLTHLDSYLTIGFVKMLAASLFTLLALSSAVDFKEALEDVDPTMASLPWADILTFVGLSALTQVKLLLPFAALFAVMVSLASLARGSEIVALKASGISPFRMAVPLVIVTLGISGIYLFAQEEFLPAAEREAQRAHDRLSGRRSSAFRASGNRWILGEDGRFWSYAGWESGSGQLANPQVIWVDLHRARVLERIEASSAHHTGEGDWVFDDGWRRSFFPGSPDQFEASPEISAAFGETPELFGAARRGLMLGRSLADQLNIQELWAHLQRLESAGSTSTVPLIVALHRKFVTPIAPALLVLLGTPLMVSGHARKKSLQGFGLALLISFGFWGAVAATESLGREGALSPVLAAWLAPTLLFILSTTMLARAR